MPARRSAGLLPYRIRDGRLEVFLVHPGGPFWANKDAGVWSIPKGEYDHTESAHVAALREFTEETGFQVEGDFHELLPVVQKSGKVVTAFAYEGDCDPEKMTCNTCMIEWPPGSGKKIEIPECDRGGWFHFEEAKLKINPAQTALLEELIAKISKR